MDDDVEAHVDIDVDDDVGGDMSNYANVMTTIEDGVANDQDNVQQWHNIFMVTHDIFVQ